MFKTIQLLITCLYSSRLLDCLHVLDVVPYIQCALSSYKIDKLECGGLSEIFT